MLNVLNIKYSDWVKEVFYKLEIVSQLSTLQFCVKAFWQYMKVACSARKKQTACLTSTPIAKLALQHFIYKAIMSFWRLRCRSFSHSVCSVFVSVPAVLCALLLNQHWCTLPCDVVVFSIWLLLQFPLSPICQSLLLLQLKLLSRLM